jgi:hypothetical protein
MQEYITGEAKSWSLFDQLIKPIPSLVYPFLFSLRGSDHLPPKMLNLANWKELIAKLLRQLVPIAFNFKGCKRVPRLFFIGK